MTIFPSFRAFITWLANGETIRVFKMTKKEDGNFTFTAAPEDFPKKHKAPIINIGIAETGTETGLSPFLWTCEPSGLYFLKNSCWFEHW